jgi:Leucine-rich repeat (LRR) protein
MTTDCVKVRHLGPQMKDRLEGVERSSGSTGDTMSISFLRFAAANALTALTLLSIAPALNNSHCALGEDAKVKCRRGSVSVYPLRNDRQLIKWVGPDSGQLPLPKFDNSRATNVVIRVVPGGMSQLRKLVSIVPIRSLLLSAVAVNDDDLDFLATSCRHLVDLRLCHSSTLAADEFKDLSDKERIELASSTLSKNGLEKIKGLTELKALHISGYTLPSSRLDFVVGLNQLEQLELCKSRITDEDLRPLSKLANLRALSLSGTAVTGEGLRFLHECHSLRALDLSWTAVSDVTLSQIDEHVLPSLDVLAVDGCNITSAGMASLRKNFPSARITHAEAALESTRALAPPTQSDAQDVRLFRCACDLLHLTATANLSGNDEHVLAAKVMGDAPLFGDWIFSELALVRGLKRLDLNGCTLSENALGHLGKYQELEQLRLAGSSVDDADLQHIVTLQHLLWIDLKRTKVTDAAIESLSKLKNLEEVSLDNTHVTDRGITALRALPKLKILGLQRCRISDEGAEILESISTLEVLAVDATQVTDRGVGALVKLPRLRWLGLLRCDVTDAGALRLLDAANLQFCQLDQAFLAPTVVDKLQHRMRLGDGSQKDSR